MTDAIDAFLAQLHEYYAAHGRNDLPWRLPEPDGSFDPYKIMVSELMLQQTQVGRVISKYHEFLTRFPNVPSLATATLGEVLIVWQGLGYNRRAKYLWQAAGTIQRELGGVFPRTLDDLVRLPGVGANTAGAILAYAWNQPAIFIETNIRTVFIHHFFKDHAGVADGALVPLIERTLDRGNPRIFYWALMDYGAYLKQTVGNLSRASKSYVKQSPFLGSKRQLRGAVLRMLAQGPMQYEAICAALADDRADTVLTALLEEGMIRRRGEVYLLA